MRDYEAAQAFLDARIGLGVAPGLERITGLLDVMADPHLAVPTVHVAGTNGKTSTVRYGGAILRSQGLTAGTFVSPHLEAIEQRYSVDGRDLSPEEFAGLVDEVAPLIELYEERSGSHITYFEATAALAFALFAGRPVGVALVEVGLGGRLDATNVVWPAVAVVTNIGRDHMGYLGDTIEAIAAEKAAIIEEGSVVVTGELPPAAAAIVASRAEEVGAPAYSYNVDFRATGAATAVGGWVVDIEGIYGSYHDIELRAHGRHQVDNFAVAVGAAETFLGTALDADAVAAGAAIGTPGRMEVLDTSPLLMIDGAHNVPAAHALAAALRREFPSTTWSLVFGAMRDKEVEGMLGALADLTDRVYAVSADSPRALDPGHIVEAAAELGLAASAYPSVGEGLEAAVAGTGPDGAVLVAGSLYVAGEARSVFTRGR